MKPTQDKIIELSELAGGLAHEIRNPLSTMMVNLQLLQEDLRELPADAGVASDFRRRARRRLDTLRNETVRLQHLLDRFLRLVSTQQLETCTTDLRSVVGEVTHFFRPEAQRRGVVLRLTQADTPLPCELDVDLLRQALLNLMVNGCQAMNDGGELVLACLRDGSHACVAITDTGPGIEADLQQRIFAPFFSTKKDGSGLGLSLTRRIVHEHGGSIRLQSEPQRGSRFTICLPLAASAGDRAEKSSPR